MQAITFAKGNEQHLKDCKDALCQSTLGEKYFLIRKQSGSTKEMAISRLEKFQTCTAPESRNT